MNPEPDAFEHLFHDYGEAYKLFKKVNNYINKLGSVKTEVFKTQISYKTKKLFAAVWLPQMWIKKRDDNSITLSIFTHKKIDNQRITEVVEPSKGYFTHHIILNSAADFNSEVKAWINVAYTESLGQD